MKCYNCGALLSEYDFCTACRADVGTYKKIIYASNRLYNEGLEKANVRDLTGAIEALRQCLRLNKNHIEARNLLGLVYFEMGETAAALSEWVISENFLKEKNIATDYIAMMQENRSALEAIDQSIRKYNQAYEYCLQDSKDLAIIQLKKVLSGNGRFIRAHQLLALLYIDSEQWEKAERELQKCLAVDHNNTLSLRYLAEVERMLSPEEGESHVPKPKKDDIIRYERDGMDIIQPRDYVEPKSGGFGTILNIVIGLVLGVAVTWFLVMPAKVERARSEVRAEVTAVNEQLDAKTSRIQELEDRVETLQNEVQSYKNIVEGYSGEDGTLRSMDKLLEVASAYLENKDIHQAAEGLEAVSKAVDLDAMSEAFNGLYRTILRAIGPELSAEYYSEGFTEYRNENYDTAIDRFSKSVYYDEPNLDAIFNLGNAYRLLGDRENAISVYQRVILEFEGTDRAKRSQQYLDELQGN